MKVVHLTISLHGGAGIACRRLHEALVENGVDSRIWTSIGSASPRVRLVQPRTWRIRARFDRVPTARYARRRIFAWWSNNWVRSSLVGAAARETPDVLHLHWVGDGWIHPQDIVASRIPMVWTLHDTWPLTGGCHYPGACTRFAGECGMCPQLGSTEVEDLSARNHRRKSLAWTKARLTAVAPSRWMRDLAARGATRGLRCTVVANGIDHRRFQPADRAAARARFRLGEHETTFLVFSGGDIADVRKGVGLIGPACSAAGIATRAAKLIVVGGGTLPQVSVPFVDAGRITAESEIIAAYQAADAFILPSLQDNLPNTVIEALACGCPVLAFAVGGIDDAVVPGTNGFLAKPASAEAFGAVIGEYLALSPERRSALRAGARDLFLQRFRADERAADYGSIYQSIAS